jgi:preprotein translocase subunit SecB
MHIEMKEVFLESVNLSFDIEQARNAGQEEISIDMQSRPINKTDNELNAAVKIIGISKRKIFLFDATYRGIFTFVDVPNELSNDDAMRLSAMCTSKIFPYLREFVADISRRIPGAPLLLPVVLGDEAALLLQARQKHAKQQPISGQLAKKAEKKPASTQKIAANTGTAKKRKKA